MFFSDIGQNIVEELSIATRGANLGWNDWEGSYRFISRQEVDLANPRGDPSMVYPVAEYGQIDPLLQNQSAASGVVVYRADDVPQLEDKVLFADNPSGEIFYVSADDLPEGGQDAIRRILLRHQGTPKTLLQVIQAKNAEQGREAATRVDLRMAEGPEGQVILLNKQDGVIRVLVR
jgi:glucose/arabinose dehydrogenase